MRLSATLLAILLCLPLVPVVHAQQDAAPSFDVDVPDPRGDVILIASNGSEQHSEKPGVDLVRFASRLEGGDLVQELTFAAPVPESDLVIRTATTFRPMTSGQYLHQTLEFRDGEAATANTRSSGATAEFSGETITIRSPAATFEGAECFAPTVRITYDPADDPITQTPEGAQGWQDDFGLMPNSCATGFGGAGPVFDGITGTCPAASIPAGVSFSGSWEDPAGDVRGGRSFPSTSLDRADADIVGASVAREGDVIEVRMRLAEFPAYRSPVAITMALVLQPQTSEYDFETKPRVSLSFNHQSYDAHGLVTTADGEMRSFFAWGEREGDDMVARFCASVVPETATCVTPDMGIEHNDNDRPFDRLSFEWNEGPCAGASTGTTENGGGGTGGNTGGGNDATGDGGDTTNDGTFDGGSGAEGDEGASGNDTPGPGLALAVLAVAGVALALRRRS